MENRIECVLAREILDSRGNPTVEAEVVLNTGERGIASVPSGASTGEFEAVELRDGGKRYLGKGVEHAVGNVMVSLATVLRGQSPFHQKRLDTAMCREDGTDNKSRLGANAILSASLAVAKAAAKAVKLPLYRYLGGVRATKLPVPMMNIINGGAHSNNSLDAQEFMIMPVGADSFKNALKMGAEVYHSLKKVLSSGQYSTAVGDEGGFAPEVKTEEEVLDLLTEAVEQAGYKCGKDICFALDVAASEWKSSRGTGFYHLPKSGAEYTAEELIERYRKLIAEYPILSIEDPLDEEDWEGWEKITRELGDKVNLVGDDLFVTNTKRLSQGIDNRCANAILIKVNQIGTLTEATEAIQMAQNAGYQAIVSHRSGETEDTTIADLSVAFSVGQIKTGAPCRGERTAKYNRLLRIEEELGDAAVYAGAEVLKKTGQMRDSVGK